MAIYHLEGQIISRSQGRTSTSAAAYRSCSTIYDERTGLTHSFEKKAPDLVESVILLPKNAPNKYHDRETLWNAVEQKEKRNDAQLCREFNISLPRELSNEENWDLAKKFIQEEFVSRGMMADINFHRGHKSQEEQPHIHVMLTMRDVNEEGFGKKNRSWNDRALLKHWREAWAQHVNERFIKLGIDMRIDNRSLEAQGIDLEPQSKIGATSAKENLARLEEHQDIARENGQRIIQNPGIVLKVITNQQSTFTHKDVARVVNRHTVDDTQFSIAYAKVMAHPELVVLCKDGRGVDRLTTKTMVVTEQGLVNDALQLFGRNKHTVEAMIQESVVREYSLSDGQREAFKYLMDDSDMRNLVGIAGSGKSYLLGAVRTAHERQGHRVIGMALAGKAAENLQHSSGIAARTVASYIASWDNGRDTLGAKDILVIDEAGMLGSVQYARLMHEAEKHGAKVISAFDSEQLQAINAGAAARAVAEKTGFVGLSEVRRQRIDWQRKATLAFSKGQTVQGLSSYGKHDNIHAFKTQDGAMRAMMDNWHEIRSSQPGKSQLMLAHTRRDVRMMNHGAREILKAENMLQNPINLTTPGGPREFCEGDRIYFMRNEYKVMDVRNGSLGTVERTKEHKLFVRLDTESKDKEGRLVMIDLKEYNDIEHGYASTIHKSQGSSVDYSHLLASKYLDRHLTYVGMSRHKEGANLYWSKDEFKDINQMAKTLSRNKAKDFTLDYLKGSLQDAATPYRHQEVSNHAADAAKINQSRQEVGPSANMADRMEKAQQRLELRAFNNQVKTLGQKIGLSLSSEIKDGDRGSYKGHVAIDTKRFGVIETSKGHGKIIPYNDFEGKLKVNGQIKVNTQQNRDNRDVLIARHTKNTSRQQKTQSREIDMGER